MTAVAEAPTFPGATSHVTPREALTQTLTMFLVVPGGGEYAEAAGTLAGCGAGALAAHGGAPDPFETG